MVNSQLVVYIKNTKSQGFTKDEIAAEVLAKGWSEVELNESLTEAEFTRPKPDKIPTAPSPKGTSGSLNISLFKLSLSNLLLFIGGLVTVLAALTYITLNWSGWDNMTRILAIFVPMLVLFVFGIYFYTVKKSLRPGTAFLVVGTLIFPFWLNITLKELNIFVDTFEILPLFITVFSTLLISILLRFSFPSPIWVLLYSGFGAPSYYLLLRLVGVSSGFESSVIWWLMFLMVPLFMAIGYFLESGRKAEFGRYAYLWGNILIIFLFTVLSAQGDLLGFLKHGDKYDEEVQKYSLILTGSIFLACSHIYRNLKDQGLAELNQYGRIFDFLGTFYILSSVFTLGLNGHKYFEETVLLLSSLSFIFVSTIKNSRIFLYGGTLFLGIYIISTGGEYFSDQVGWPITLFIIGILTMFGGYSVNRVRLKYFGSSLT